MVNIKDFFIGGACVGNSQLKFRSIEKFLKAHKDSEIIEGIAIDEPERLARMKNRPNHISVLEQFNLTEEMTYDICKKHNLLSPTYKNNSRGGCWFCPNSKIKEMAELKVHHPHLWQELEKLNQEQNKIGNYLLRNKKFDQVNAEVDAYIEKEKAQIKIDI